MTVGQAEFTSALLDPKQSTPKGLIDPHGRPAVKRFDVYRNNVVSSLLEAMRTAFPVINKLVGSDFFDSMSGIYVRQHPPQSPLLMFYGQEFPEFLETFEHVAHLPYLADVARLELARRTCYHAADSTPIDPNQLIELPEDALMKASFEIAPNVMLLSSPYPVQSIWINNTNNPDHPIQAGHEHILIYRPQLDVMSDAVPYATYSFLNDIKSGITLGQAFDSATKVDETFDLSSALGTLLNAAMITNIKGNL